MIAILRPVSDVGSPWDKWISCANLVPCGGSQYTQVDDDPIHDSTATTILADSNDSSQCYFEVEDLPGDAFSINSVKIHAYFCRDDAQATQIRPYMKLRDPSTTVQNDYGYSIISSGQYPCISENWIHTEKTCALDPNGAPWTVATVNAIQMGVDPHFYGPNCELHMTMIYLEVDYVEFTPCEDWLTQEDCEDAGCYWWNGSCHTLEPLCTELDNQTDCELYGCYWYDDACHSAPQPDVECDTCTTFKITGYKKDYLGNYIYDNEVDFNLPDWGDINGKIVKDLQKFNFWSGGFKVYDAGLSGKSVSITGTEYLPENPACFPLCFPFCFCKTPIQKFIKLDYMLDRPCIFKIEGIGECFDAYYVIRSFKFDTIPRSRGGYQWTLDLEYRNKI